MRMIFGVFSMLAALGATDASAQGVNLSGRWQCVELCAGPPGGFAFITQYGRELNVVNEAGDPSRAWVDYPGRIWIESANQGAILCPKWPNAAVRPRSGLATGPGVAPSTPAAASAQALKCTAFHRARGSIWMPATLV